MAIHETSPAAHNAESDELRWRIACRSADQQEHEAKVLVMGDRVALILPGGNTCVLEPGEARELAWLLDQVQSSQLPAPRQGSAER